MKNRNIFVAFTGIVLSASILAAGCSGGTDSAADPDLTAGSGSVGEFSSGTAGELGSLKSFSATALDGSTFTQEDIMAKDMTIINFWSLTCGPCIEEMPDLAAFAKVLPDNVQVITVCLDGARDEEYTENLLSETEYEGVTLLSGDGDFMSVVDNIQYTPTTVIVDAKGNLVGDAIIGRQKDLSETFLAAVNTALEDAGKEEISLEE
ncbi:MAG: TlpA family protein disulfide reductase [Eubacterium sp.]|nr:TlpA family protein disulfide reductase [Eubacterium sp.]